jgi:hypothetical protein
MSGNSNSSCIVDAISAGRHESALAKVLGNSGYIVVYKPALRDMRNSTFPSPTPKGGDGRWLGSRPLGAESMNVD